MRMSQEVTGDSAKCFINRITSGGGSSSSGAIGRGNLLRASALLCDCVSLNDKLYSYEDRNKDHRRIRADACGEVEQCSLRSANKGLWSVIR